MQQPVNETVPYKARKTIHTSIYTKPSLRIDDGCSPPLYPFGSYSDPLLMYITPQFFVFLQSLYKL